jgi:hypothetical protein
MFLFLVLYFLEFFVDFWWLIDLTTTWTGMLFVEPVLGTCLCWVLVVHITESDKEGVWATYLHWECSPNVLCIEGLLEFGLFLVDQEAVVLLASLEGLRRQLKTESFFGA